MSVLPRPQPPSAGPPGRSRSEPPGRAAPRGPAGSAAKPPSGSYDSGAVNGSHGGKNFFWAASRGVGRPGHAAGPEWTCRPRPSGESETRHARSDEQEQSEGGNSDDQVSEKADDPAAQAGHREVLLRRALVGPANSQAAEDNGQDDHRQRANTPPAERDARDAEDQRGHGHAVGRGRVRRGPRRSPCGLRERNWPVVSHGPAGPSRR